MSERQNGLDERKSGVVDLDLMRNMNKALLLNLIRREGPISRAEIAKRTRLSRSTVSNLIASLLEDNLIQEVGAGESQGGRPPILLTFNDQAGLIVGVDLATNHLLVIVTDLEARILTVSESDFAVSVGPAAGLKQVIEQVRETVRQGGFDFARVSGVGVAVPGPLDYATGMVVSPPIMPGWSGFPIRSHLRTAFGVPVYVDNDANLAAMSELWRGAGQGCQHLAYIKLETGIGCGLIIGGEIYRGNTGSAGEIGHLMLDENGPICKCGSVGCLEAIAGIPAIVQRAEAAILAGRPTSLVTGGGNRLTMRRLIEAARQGDALSRELFRDAGQSIGVAVADLINLINPALVIVGGSLSEVGDILLDPIRQTVQTRALKASVEQTRIVQGQIGREATAIGAAMLVLQEIFRGPDVDFSPHL